MTSRTHGFNRFAGETEEEDMVIWIDPVDEDEVTIGLITDIGGIELVEGTTKENFRPKEAVTETPVEFGFATLRKNTERNRRLFESFAHRHHVVGISVTVSNKGRISFRTKAAVLDFDVFVAKANEFLLSAKTMMKRHKNAARAESARDRDNDVKAQKVIHGRDHAQRPKPLILTRVQRGSMG